MHDVPRTATTWTARIEIGLLSVLLLSAGYYGLYRLALDEEQMLLGIGPTYRYSAPLYRVSFSGSLDHGVECILDPAYRFDRVVRSGSWEPSRTSKTSFRPRYGIPNETWKATRT